MKSCPTCNRTYPDDTLAFCLVDGAVLSASYDPEKTGSIPSPRITEPPATELLDRSDVGTPRIQSTIRAATPYVPPLNFPQVSDRTSKSSKRSLVPWLVVGAVTFLIGIIGVAIVVSKLSSTESSTQRASPSPTSTPVTPAKMCDQTVSPAILDKWIELGGETGKLGCPINQLIDAPVSPQESTGRWIQFSKGDGGYLIEYRSGTRAGKVFEVSGCMFKLYASLGGTKSWLGFPTGDGYETSPGARQEFEGGYVVWDRKTYVCRSHKY